MTQITHHPDDATLLAYAAGAVTEAIGLVVAAHTELCPSCLARVAQAEALGGVLLATLPGGEPPAGDLERVWREIAAAGPWPARQGTGARPDQVPALLAPYLPDGLAGAPWRALAPGIRRHRLRNIESGRGTIQLLAIAPGVTLPRHTHRGTELTLVLAGSYSDELGRFGRGDVADLDPSVSHRPVADPGASCVCLIATDERLRFTGVLSRLLQPLVGI